MLRFGNFLAPKMMSVYQAVAKHIGQRLGLPVSVDVGQHYESAHTDFDVQFICGLAYVELRRAHEHLEAIAAPVLSGDRYQNRPIYFSDVVVHQDSPFTCFADLRGCTWSYNEPYSQSGYGITRYHLVQMGEPVSFFGKVIQAGWHDRSIEMICNRDVDASAIDSHVLALAMRDNPSLKEQFRVIDTLGPSTIQPVTVSSQIPASLRLQIQQIFTELADDPDVQAVLRGSLVHHFASIEDNGYDDLRAMGRACEAAGCTSLTPTFPCTSEQSCAVNF